MKFPTRRPAKSRKRHCASSFGTTCCRLDRYPLWTFAIEAPPIAIFVCCKLNRSVQDCSRTTMTIFDAAAPAAPPGPAGRPTPPFFIRIPGSIWFLGRERDYWRLMLRGAALLAVTLGIYRFWLTTDQRRFLWSNTEVFGQTLE